MLFPRPHSVGTWVWTVVCLTYLGAVTVVCVVSGQFDLTWDGEGGASLAAVVPVMLTFPLGVLAFGLPWLGGDSNAAIVSFYALVWLAGAFQAWVVWRLGVGLAGVGTARAPGAAQG